MSETGIYTSVAELSRLEHKAKGFTFLPRQPIRSLLAGRHASRLRGRGLNFEEIRRYLPGDDIRTMDWKVTQRTGKPHVRVFTEERDRPAYLLVDQRVNMFFGTEVAMKSVVAAELAALAAWRIFAVGDRPGALVFDDREIREVRPHRSRRRVTEILALVAEKNRALDAGPGRPSEPAMLNRALRAVGRLAAHDCLIVVVSDFFGYDATSRRLLARLAAHNDVVATLLYDPIKIEVRPSGRLVATDGALQIELPAGHRRERQELAASFEAELRSTKDDLAKAGIPVLLVDTVEDPAAQIRRLFGHVAPIRRF